MADVETDHQQNFNFLKANHRQQIPLHPQRIHSDIQNDPKKGDKLGNLYVWYGSDDCIGFAIILACCQQQHTTDTSSNLREHSYVL